MPAANHGRQWQRTSVLLLPPPDRPENQTKAKAPPLDVAPQYFYPTVNFWLAVAIYLQFQIQFCFSVTAGHLSS